MKFKYKKLLFSPVSPFLGKTVIRPIIPITISHKNKSVRYDALIDSGADFCILPAELGEYIEIEIKKGIKENFGGIQKQKDCDNRPVAYIHEIILEVGGYKNRMMIGFSYDIAQLGCGILGQKGFFNLFNVSFDYRRGEVELKAKTDIN